MVGGTCFQCHKLAAVFNFLMPEIFVIVCPIRPVSLKVVQTWWKYFPVQQERESCQTSYFDHK
jgi:hypothetical protein